MAFDPRYFSQIDGDLSSAPTLGESRRFSYTTTEGQDTITTLGFFPTETKMQIGDRLDVLEVDNLNPIHRTSARMYTLVVAGFDVT